SATLTDRLESSAGSIAAQPISPPMALTLRSQASAPVMEIQALSSSSPSERAAAACSLGRASAVESIPALIQMLGDETSIKSINCWESGRWNPALRTFKYASPGEE